MATGSVSSNSGLLGAPFRIFCGCLTLALSLICVVSSFSHATTMSGQDAVTMWGFFLWGVGLAWGGIWLIRGHSKGKRIVFARSWKRLLVAALLALLVVGMLLFLLSLPSVKDDAVWWPIMLQTMFANLFGTLPFVLFDREDYKEPRQPARLDAAGRRKVRHRIILVVIVGGLMLTAGLTVGQQIDRWWEDLLVRLGVGLLAGAAVLGFRLRKAPTPNSGTDSE
jgi:hypothetical protein